MWLVAVRVTFAIERGGKLSLADVQPPPLLAPEYRGDPGATSLRADSDLLAVRPVTDVLVEASAHAPRGRPAATVPVALRVGALEKTLVVHGTRVYYKGPLGLTTSAPLPFVVQPIIYEWAYGGTDLSDPDPRRQRWDARNPVGKGIAAQPARLEHQPAHAIEYPSGNPATTGPAGFGPIDRSWSPRREWAGTYDERWERTKKPLLPDDYDGRFALAAPPDQRVTKALRGGETITLVNLTPEGVLRFDLPRLHFGLTTRFGFREVEHPANLTSVHIDAETMHLGMVWQSSLRVPARQVEHLDKTVVVEKTVLR